MNLERKPVMNVIDIHESVMEFVTGTWPGFSRVQLGH